MDIIPLTRSSLKYACSVSAAASTISESSSDRLLGLANARRNSKKVASFVSSLLSELVVFTTKRSLLTETMTSLFQRNRVRKRSGSINILGGVCPVRAALSFTFPTRLVDGPATFLKRGGPSQIVKVSSGEADRKSVV